MKISAVLCVLALCGLMPVVNAQTDNQQDQSFKRIISKEVSAKFVLSLPKDYAKNKKQKWPLVMFLHGSGERGDDLAKVKVHGPPKLAAKGKDFPFILISPQCPENEWWNNETLNALLDTIVEKYRVDESRIYCTGLSMGGFGTWSLAIQFPKRFAAIAPLCGGGDTRQVHKIAKVPVWCFHGAKDTSVPIEEDQKMVDQLKKDGGNVKFTIYPEASHDCWTETYDNPEFYEWLLAQSKPKE